MLKRRNADESGVFILCTTCKINNNFKKIGYPAIFVTIRSQRPWNLFFYGSFEYTSEMLVVGSIKQHRAQ